MENETKRTRVAVPQVTTKNKVEIFDTYEIRTALNEKRQVVFACPMSLPRCATERTRKTTSKNFASAIPN